eukprot:IDg9384t1
MAVINLNEMTRVSLESQSQRTMMKLWPLDERVSARSMPMITHSSGCDAGNKHIGTASVRNITWILPSAQISAYNVQETGLSGAESRSRGSVPLSTLSTNDIDFGFVSMKFEKQFTVEDFKVILHETKMLSYQLIVDIISEIDSRSQLDDGNHRSTSASMRSPLDSCKRPCPPSTEALVVCCHSGKVETNLWYTLHIPRKDLNCAGVLFREYISSKPHLPVTAIEINAVKAMLFRGYRGRIPFVVEGSFILQGLCPISDILRKTEEVPSDFGTS